MKAVMNVYTKDYVTEIVIGDKTEKEFETLCSQFTSLGKQDTVWVYTEKGTFYSFRAAEIQYIRMDLDKK